MLENMHNGLFEILNDATLYLVEEKENGDIEYVLDENKEKQEICKLGEISSNFNTVSLSDNNYFSFQKGKNHYIQDYNNSNPGPYPLATGSAYNESIQYYVVPINESDIVNKKCVSYNKDGDTTIFYRNYPFLMDRHHVAVIPTSLVNSKYLFFAFKKLFSVQKFGWGDNVANAEEVKKYTIKIPQNYNIFDSFQMQLAIAKNIEVKIADIDRRLSLIDKMEKVNEMRREKEINISTLGSEQSIDTLYLVEEKEYGELEYVLDENGEKQEICEFKNIVKWDVKSIKDKTFAMFFSGTSPDSKYYNEDGEGYEFHQGKTHFGEISINSSPIYTTELTTKSIKNDILISMRAPAGALNLNLKDNELCLGRGLGAIRVMDGNSYKYVFYALKASPISGKMGMGYTSITNDDVKNISIRFPSLFINNGEEYTSYQIQLAIAKNIEEKMADIDSQNNSLNNIGMVLKLIQAKIINKSFGE